MEWQVLWKIGELQQWCLKKNWKNKTEGNQIVQLQLEVGRSNIIGHRGSANNNTEGGCEPIHRIQSAWCRSWSSPATRSVTDDINVSSCTDSWLTLLVTARCRDNSPRSCAISRCCCDSISTTCCRDRCNWQTITNIIITITCHGYIPGKPRSASGLFDWLSPSNYYSANNCR